MSSCLSTTLWILMVPHLLMQQPPGCLPDSTCSPASQHSIARISFHKYHFYHRNLNIEIGNRINCEFVSPLLKSIQQLFTTLIYVNNPCPSSPSLSLVLSPPAPFLLFHVWSFHPSHTLLAVPSTWLAVSKVLVLFKCHCLQLRYLLPTPLSVHALQYLLLKLWLNSFGRLSTIQSDAHSNVFSVS